MALPRAVFRLCWKLAVKRGLTRTARFGAPQALGAVRRARCRRQGKILIFLVLALPVFMAIAGLVFDAGLMLADSHNLKHAVDAGATAGAMDLLLGKSDQSASDLAISYVENLNDVDGADVTVAIPPNNGAYAGRSGFLEVIASRPFHSRFMHLAGAAAQHSITARAVAGYQASTTGAAVVVLDPNPSPLSIAPVGLTLPSFPAIVGGLEVVGAGTVRVDGAVLVNTLWGGVDENGNPAGNGPGPPYGISCMPLVQLTNLEARDIRVAGGVDNPSNYGSFVSGESSPLRANRLPVADPYANLPAPSMQSDPAHVNPTLRGGVQVIALPLISPPTVLRPGVYEWIEVTSGQAIFQPGIYIIRNVNPTTRVALNISGGTVTANGVMFYVTNSPNYDAATGTPDDADGEAAPSTVPSGSMTPSAIINLAIAGNLAPLNDSRSPFDHIIIYQRRRDYRPLVVTHQSLLLGGGFSGTMYAKWGHIVFLGTSTYDCRFVAGTVRLGAVTGMTIAPSSLLPPAQDVFLVE